MPLGAHLDELRKRLIWAMMGLLPILIASMAFGAQILDFLIQPVEKALQAEGFPGTLVSIGPTEAFATYMKVGLIATVAVGLPWVLYQLWLFVAPGLYSAERRYVYLLLPLSSVLMLSSMVFLYRLVLPLVLAFFVNFGVTLGARHSVPHEVPAGTTFLNAPVLAADPLKPMPGDVWLNSSMRALRVCIGEKNGQPDVCSLNLTKEAGIRPEYRGERVHRPAAIADDRVRGGVPDACGGAAAWMGGVDHAGVPEGVPQARGVRDGDRGGGADAGRCVDDVPAVGAAVSAVRARRGAAAGVPV